MNPKFPRHLCAFFAFYFGALCLAAGAGAVYALATVTPAEVRK